MTYLAVFLLGALAVAGAGVYLFMKRRAARITAVVNAPVTPAPASK